MSNNLIDIEQDFCSEKRIFINKIPLFPSFILLFVEIKPIYTGLNKRFKSERGRFESLKY